MASTGARGGRKRGPSIADVARLAGVSAQTVSRVSTGAEAVKPETRAKVLLAMEQLGYSPNRAARALRDGRYGSIGFLARRFDRTGEALTMDAVLRACEAEDYSVTLLSAHDTTSAEWEPAARRLQNQTVDGIIIMRAEGGAGDPLALPATMPVVVSDSRAHGRYPRVTTDEMLGARRAVEHLLDLGHETVHYLAGPEDSEPARLRTIGWRAALTDRGRATPEPIWGDWTPQSGYAAGSAFAADPTVTAIFCANDEMAFGLMLALHAAGKDIPGDISVVGFDGISLGRYSVPPLTTIRQDFPQIGRELVRMVLRQIGQTHPHSVPDSIVPLELVVRDSSAPPRR
ncbi:LacI family DNA-binding transcriptional regulator [Demequina sp. NBRC 110056]|uniref:LacI family DNA-binding transcriptional regulator n=1 Tax=Demequina sp. NBRC 110056 TaxID=1570345 RepID=UPI000A060E20|nr:LacI family DNA-binding transcriptional regulator [Demequina sp. NBRC 110056]